MRIFSQSYFSFLGAVVLLFFYSATTAQTVITLSGYVYENSSGERVPFASVTVAGSTKGALTNAYGFYSLRVPGGDSIRVVCSALGYERFEKVVSALADDTVSIALVPVVTRLKEVVISEKVTPSSNLIKLQVNALKNIPSLLGERDIIKSLQLLPGVSRGTEGFAAFYVRGGGADQNLILLDEAPVYNANHVFGLFSAFNADAIRNISFWKDDFPARYGGRLSSVLDLQMKEGSRQQFRAEGGIGLTSSRLTLEGPIAKDKASFIVSGRRSYLDLIMKPFMPDNEKLGYYFYDLNAKLNWKVDDKNQLYISAYLANDLLSERNVVTRKSSRREMVDKLGWGSTTATLRWNRQLGSRGFVNTTFYHTRYRFSMLSREHRVTDSTQTSENLDFSSSVWDYSLKTDMDYFLSRRHTLRAGGQWIGHGFRPRRYSAGNTATGFSNRVSEFERNQEIALYAEDRFTLNERWEASFGLRFSTLLTAGKDFFRPEPRLSVAHRLPGEIVLTTAWSRTNQFVHLLSNTGLGLSTDLYVPVTAYTPPQQADQVSGTLKKYFAKPGIELTMSTYRKWMRHITAYKDGASFLSIGDEPRDIPWQENITIGKGKSYGTELLLRKDAGRLTGWIGYTLSWTVHQFPDLNNGKPFFPKYDRRHNLSLTGSYQLSDQVKLSANWVYYTGNYVSAPYAFSYGLDRYAIHDYRYLDSRAYAGYRNSFKTPGYHRLDLGIQFHKKKKWGSRYWEISFYNAYLRENHTYFYIRYDPNAVGGRKAEIKGRSMFSIVPSISYNFRIGAI
ncbi:TonB-dependent receptor [Ravibacter arvi]|uniref:TonB-dependent receptor n=1 Tax=Ravibacter arvi TaxID=2051041 RepID=A0ABP8M2M0_9BACT